MKDKQKVFIQGNPERGDDVIKILENLGGNNAYSLSGVRDNAYYFINPSGTIDNTCIDGGTSCPFLKEFYKEIELPRWKPEYSDRYFYINDIGGITENRWYGTDTNESHYKFGNCFKEFKDAEVARDKIKEILNK